jgi:hypothetical protein
MKGFDFVCNHAHKFYELYRADEEIPDELPCVACEQEGRPDVKMVRVRFYPTAGVMLPSAPGTYSQGF